MLVALLYAVVSRSDDDGGGGVTVFAAASLREVTDALEAAWDEAYPDYPLTVATEAQYADSDMRFRGTCRSSAM